MEMTNLPLAASFITGPQAAMLAAIAVATTMMLLANHRRRREGGPSPRAYAREQLSRLREEKAVHDDIAELMLQLERIAREMNAHLDAKFVRLERAIRDADQRIARLDGSQPATDRSTIDVTVGDDAPLPPRKSGGRLNRERVYALADTGNRPAEIARSMGVSVGEIDLVLALRKPVTPQTLRSGQE